MGRAATRRLSTPIRAQLSRYSAASRAQALRHAVIRLGLCAGLMLRDAGDHRGRNQGAFHRHGIEGERGRAAGPIAGYLVKPRSEPERRDR
jgi:hypothetical protein